MHSEEQTDQNPVVNTTQEEKTVKSEQSELKKETTQQISKEEKTEIGHMLADEKKEPAIDVKNETVTPKINEGEKEAVVEKDVTAKKGIVKKVAKKKATAKVVDKKPAADKTLVRKAAVKKVAVKKAPSKKRKKKCSTMSLLLATKK